MNTESLELDRTNRVQKMDYHTVDEAAEMSGMSSAWWRKQVFEKRIEFCRISRRVFIPGKTIRGLFEAGTVKPEKGLTKSVQ